MSPASLRQLREGISRLRARILLFCPCLRPSRGAARIPRPCTQCARKGQEDTCRRVPARTPAWHAGHLLTSGASSQEVERHGPARRAGCVLLLLGPGPRLAVATPAIWPPGAQPGRGGDWMATPRKALPWRPACRASPRTARTAPSASAPAGAERNQSVSEARTHPVLRVPPPSLIGWARLEGVASGAAGGGASRLSRQRLCFSGPPARRKEGAVRWAHCTLEPRTSQPHGPKGGARSASILGPLTVFGCDSPAQPHRPCLCQEDTVASAHVERRDSPKAYFGLGLSLLGKFENDRPLGGASEAPDLLKRTRRSTEDPVHPGRDRDLSLKDVETFSNRRGLWMGPEDGRVPPSPTCSWEPPAGQIRGAGI